MKQLKYIFIMLLTTFMGCNDSSDNIPPALPDCPASVATPGVKLYAIHGGANTFVLDVNIDGAWSATLSESATSWASIQLNSADAASSSVSTSGKTQLHVTVKVNKLHQARTADIYFDFNDNTYPLRFSQKSLLAGVADYRELLKMNMGEVGEELDIDDMPFSGLGVANVSFEPNESAYLESIIENRSTSVEGLYDASSKGYLNLGDKGMYKVRNLAIDGETDVTIHFGLTQLLRDTMDTQSFVVKFTTTEGVNAGALGNVWTIVPYQYYGDSAEWSLATIDIPAAALNKGKFLHLSFESIEVIPDPAVDSATPTDSEAEELTFATLIDDIYVYEKASSVPPLAEVASIASISETTAIITAAVYNMPEGTPTDVALIDRVRIAYREATEGAAVLHGDSIANTEYLDTIIGLKYNQTYEVFAVVRLKDGTELESVVKEFTTLPLPHLELTSPSQTLHSITVESAMVAGEGSLAEVVSQGFKYRKTDAADMIDVPIEADASFTTTIKELIEGDEYEIVAYSNILVGGVETFISDTAKIFTRVTPIDMYTEKVLIRGRIQHGIESTLEFLVPHNGELSDLSLTYAIQGDAKDYLQVVKQATVATSDYAGYTHLTTYKVTGIPNDTTQRVLNVQFTRRDDRYNPQPIRVAMFATDGSYPLTDILIGDYGNQISVEANRYDFVDFNDVNDTTSLRIIHTAEASGFKPNGKKTNCLVQFAYVIKDVDNPSEYIVIESSNLPLGIDMSNVEVNCQMSCWRKPGTGENLKFKFSLSADKGNSWIAANDHYIYDFIAGGTTHEILPKFNVSAADCTELTLRISMAEVYAVPVGNKFGIQAFKIALREL